MATSVVWAWREAPKARLQRATAAGVDQAERMMSLWLSLAWVLVGARGPLPQPRPHLAAYPPLPPMVVTAGGSGWRWRRAVSG